MENISINSDLQPNKKLESIIRNVFQRHAIYIPTSQPYIKADFPLFCDDEEIWLMLSEQELQIFINRLNLISRIL